MAQLGKLEVQTEMKCPADKFYGFFKYNMNSLVQMFPENFKSCEILGGSELKAGTVMCWKYSLAGSPVMTVKIKIEVRDDARKLITFVVLEGDILKLYKSFKANLLVGTGYVKWTLEFEKANENAPNPDAYAEVAAKVSKGLDAYFCKS